MSIPRCCDSSLRDVSGVLWAYLKDCFAAYQLPKTPDDYSRKNKSSTSEQTKESKMHSG